MTAGYGTVLVVRRQARNTDGDRVGPAVDTVYDGWEIAPVSSIETTDGGTREAVTTRLQAYGGPPDHDVGAGDRVWLASDDRTKPPPWAVIGLPELWGTDECTGWTPGSVITLQRTTG